MGLQGKGFFIWKIPNCEGGDPVAIANVAKAAGLSHVLIKIADGIYTYNYDYTRKVDLVPAVALELRKKGIQVWGWHYVYGYNPLGEAKIAIQRTQQLQLDGYVIDAEGEYKEAGKAAAATKFMDALRASLPNTPVALCSYRYPSYHPAFPWKEFLAKSTYNMPQVYWEQAHNPGAQLTKSYNEFQNKTPIRPYLATGAAYSAGGWTPTVADVTEFLKTAKALNIPAVNFFSWDYARRSLRSLWDAIAAFSWSAPTTPPKDLPDLLIAALNTHDPNLAMLWYKSDAVHITAARTIQGTEAIKAYYTTLLTQTLPNATFKITGVSGTGGSRHFTWTATSTKGKITNGNDTIGIMDGQIAYHYSYYTITT